MRAPPIHANRRRFFLASANTESVRRSQEQEQKRGTAPASSGSLHVAVGLPVARHAVRPFWHPSFTGQSLSRAGVRRLGVAGRDPLTDPKRVEGLMRAVFGAPPKRDASPPTISTSKGTMPAWSWQRGGPLGVRQPLGVIRWMLEQFQGLLRPAHGTQPHHADGAPPWR